ncbi:hypothetical protein BXZ70DRAFT_155676 [Cristinia sonorae]|uniref:Uncharacterized protein n=1 Tax=Cristinia sonorae TaxID=1940300 RepID=A0A8K0XPX8_9AGAR|nr:hypothetical protein BXZ70DRAFT_155676 [Cristinia sonorae]
MNARKRRAEPLLPLRAAKVARTTRHHPLCGNATPSQEVGLMARWTAIVAEFMELGRDTLSSFFGKSTEEPFEEHVPLPTPPPADSPPRRSCSSHDARSRPHKPLPQSRDHPPARRPLLPPPARSVSHPSISQTARGVDAQKSGTGMPAELDEALANADRKRYGKELVPRTDRRQHIFAQKHKAAVREENEKTREEMKREAYQQLQETHSFSGSFSEFEGM